MRTIGIDLGTTTVSAVVLDGKNLVATETRSNDTDCSRQATWERSQDPERLVACGEALLRELLERFPDVDGIGLTGQQHGILYLNRAGRAVSPLYTWQDERGTLEHQNGESCAAWMSRVTGYPMAAGYGLVTHAYNLHHGLVPQEAACLCTIADYLGMRLCGRRTPALNATHAAGLGCYSLERDGFDVAALRRAGLGESLLPGVTSAAVIGSTAGGVPVSVAIGDNQASFIGATGGRRAGALLNVGTGSQVSIYTPELFRCDGLETRPFPGGGFLLVGASLCGGRAYALLEQFFRQTVEMVTGESRPCYDAMTRLVERCGSVPDPPTFTPTFAGTREDAGLRGSITGISTTNMTPLHWICGMLDGIGNELYQLYQYYLRAGGAPVQELYGAGNGLRRNPHLCTVLEARFGVPLRLSDREEEAACGAACFIREAIAYSGQRRSTEGG